MSLKATLLGPERFESWTAETKPKAGEIGFRNGKGDYSHRLYMGGVAAIQTMTVTGAKLGMQVDISFSLDCQGIVMKGWVSAADVVSYVFGNPLTGAPVNLASGTVRARVWTYLP